MSTLEAFLPPTALACTVDIGGHVQERWEEMDWDSNGDISFGEFVYAVTKWIDVDGEEETVSCEVDCGVLRSRCGHPQCSAS